MKDVGLGLIAGVDRPKVLPEAGEFLFGRGSGRAAEILFLRFGKRSHEEPLAVPAGRAPQLDLVWRVNGDCGIAPVPPPQLRPWWFGTLVQYTLGDALVALEHQFIAATAA